MGVFDLFGREPRSNQASKREERLFSTEREPITQTEGTKGPVAIFSPTSYKDVEKIIDALKSNKTAIVHLTELKTETSIRILDMLSGAIYAIGGGVYEMEKNIFMFSPQGIEVNQ
ncbi:MAG: cell division protein SepF [Clostridia bacterium]|nr:cell division protein SepF [Clostridia bacterium]